MDEMGKEEEEEELRKADCPKCLGDFIQNASKPWLFTNSAHTSTVAKGLLRKRVFYSADILYYFGEELHD